MREVRQQLERGEPLLVVDVRQATNGPAAAFPRRTSSKPGAPNADLEHLPHDRPIATHCGHGQRAATGSSVLEQRGYRNLAIIGEGIDDWRKAGGHVQQGAPSQPKLPAHEPGGRPRPPRPGSQLAAIHAAGGDQRVRRRHGGLERAVLPLLAEQDFLLTSRTAILSFIVTFGVTKALANLFAGRMSDRIGRKKILVAGWIVGLPVPVLIMLGPSWDWIIAANILLASTRDCVGRPR